ncbi:beta strand repeat-containing protein, partial [Patescibacteria group bacterium]
AAASTWSTTAGDLTLSADAASVNINANEAAADQIKLSAAGTIAGNAINITTTDGGIILDANDATNGDITIDAADDLTLTAAGNLVFTGFDCTGQANGGALTADAAGVITCTADDSGGAAAGGMWQEGAGADAGSLSPINNTWDVLIGSTATASAKFAFLNVNSGTPTASISANSGDNATFLTGTGNLGTTNAQTLTLGGATSGDILFQPNQDTGDYLKLTSDATDLTIATTDGAALNITAAGAISIDGTGASNVSATSGDLTVSTITSGNLILLADDDIYFQADNDTTNYLTLSSDAADLTLATTDGAALNITAAGAISIDGTGASNVSATSGNLTVSTITSGNLILLSDDNLYLQADNDATNYLTLSSDATDLTLATTDASALSITPAGALTLTSAGAATWSSSTGALVVSGDDGLTLTAANTAGITMNSTAGTFLVTATGQTIDLDATTLDVDTSGAIDLLAAGAFSIDGTGASNVSATSGDLTLSTITSGNLILLADDDIYFQADNDTTNYLTLSSDATDLTLATTDAADLDITPAGDNLTFKNTVDAVTGIQFFDSDAGVPILNIDTTSELVGIGTAAPEALLEIQAIASTDAILALDADAGTDDNDTWFIESETADNDLSFVQHTAERAKIDSSGYFYAQRFADLASDTYYLDPADAGVSLNILGDAVIGGGEVLFTPTDSPTTTSEGNVYYDDSANHLFLYTDDASWHRVALDMTKYSGDNASVADGSYLEVVHSQTTNDLLATAWVYDGAKYVEIDDLTYRADLNDPELQAWWKLEEASGNLDNAEGTAANDLIASGSATYQQAGKKDYSIDFDGTSDWFCSGSTCGDIDNFDFDQSSFSIGGWFKHDTATDRDMMITKHSDSASIDVGDGADGAITIGANTDINATNSISGRTCVDGGDAVNYSIDTLSSTTAVLTSTPSTGCIVAGDEVLIINQRGTSTNYANVGNYETLTVSSISTATITFSETKQNYYGSGASDDTNIGTGAGEQRVMLQRVPNYTNVTISGGFNFYPTAWDHTKNGVLFFRATGTLSVAGTIHANSRGYQGGNNTIYTDRSTGEGGEAFCGIGGAAVINENDDGNAGAGGSGGGWKNGPNAGGAGQCGGGGGGGVTLGTGGAGSASLGGAGGGGGGYRCGGGGAGYGTFGYGGLDPATGSGENGGEETSGDGNTVDQNDCGGGGGGGTYGDTTLTQLFMGSGGGQGAEFDVSGTETHGGYGGGIVVVAADTISVAGGIDSIGGNGVGDGANSGGGGGGGAGGSVKILGDSVTLGDTLVTATGGTGGNGAYDGGVGGDGRIAVEYATSISVTATDPVHTATQVTASAGGYKLYMENEGNIVFGIDDDETGFPEDVATSSATFDDNAWHHVVGVKNETDNLKLFVDGREIASDYSINSTGSLSNNEPLYLGVDSNGTSYPWDGTMDEIFVYSRVLSAAEIEEIYQANSKYWIEQTDNSKVRLYNASGNTQSLRLDIIVHGADLAEWYTVDDQTIQAGDLVSLTGQMDQYNVPILTKARDPSDPMLIGAISTRAGQELGLKTDNRRLLALVGRIPVNIDPQSDPISAGDLITSSPTAGLAQKAQPGDISIGKAVEAWTPDSGQSTVLIFVTSPTPSFTPTTDPLDIVDQIFDNLIASVITAQQAIIDRLTVTQKLIAPTIETEILATNFISPLADKPITITGPIEINGDASVSGNLTAESITSPTITVLRNKIQNLASQLDQPTIDPPEVTDINTLNNLYELLNAQQATDSANLDIASVNADFGFFSDYLAVMGQTTLTTVSINNSLTINDSMILAANSISTLDETLYLQPAGNGAINFLAGLVTMDQTGQVTINGDLNVTGTLLANQAKFNQLTLTSPVDRFANLLEIVDASGSALASINASGSAKFKNLSTEGLIIATPEASSSATTTPSATLTSITTNATAGQAILPAGATEFTINTPHVTTDTLTYVTPTGDPQNQVLYVRSKKDHQWFKIAINQPLPYDLKFNWWIIRLQ